MKKFSFLICSMALIGMSSCGGGETKPAGAGGDSTATSTAAVNGEFKADVTKSIVGWLGAKAAYNHVGTVKVKSGSLTVANSQITGGAFEVDMNTIMENGLGTFNNQEKVNDLVAHLKSPEFFEVEKYPASNIVIKEVKQGGEMGATHTFTCDLTVKGITKPVIIPATVAVSANEVKVTAAFKVNRAEYDVQYSSSAFFKDLGDKVIGDNIEFSVDLVAVK